MEQKQLGVNLQMNMDDFEGRFANFFQVATFGPEARLDCVYVDNASLSSDGEALGKVVARINMTTKSLFELKDLLNRHIAESCNPGEADDAR